MNYMKKLMTKTQKDITIGDSLVLTGIICLICAMPVGILYVKEEIEKKKKLNEITINSES